MQLSLILLGYLLTITTALPILDFNDHRVRIVLESDNIQLGFPGWCKLGKRINGIHCVTCEHEVAELK